MTTRHRDHLAMLRIEILSTKWWIRNKRRDLPSTWNEVPQPRLLACLRHLISMPREDAAVFLLQELLQVPATNLALMDADSLAALFAAIDWMRLEPSAVPPVRSFAHRGVAYHLPTEKFGNGRAIEYPLADEFYTKFAETGDAAHLLMLVATLCREANPTTGEVERTGDIRLPLDGRAQIAPRAARLAGLPMEWQVVVLMYFAGVKQMVHRMYGKDLFGDDESIEGGEAAPKKDGTLFGWWGVYMDVAENLTNLEKVYQMNFHTVCMFLVKRKREADEQLLKMNLQRSGNDKNG